MSAFAGKADIRKLRRQCPSKTLASVQGALAGPVSAYMYDWNMLPIGQLLWEKELMSYKTFPPLQAAETYNLDGILKAIQAANNHPSD